MADAVFEFADFKLDCSRFELLRDGSRIRLERKPMELLVLLVSSEGRLVSRAEIAERLWDSEVFVDTEHGINTAIRKIRTVLRDDPESPRFIQTVTGMGYRFVAPVTMAAGGLPAQVERGKEEGQNSSEVLEKHASGAKAPVNSAGVIPGINPRPTAPIPGMNHLSTAPIPGMNSGPAGTIPGMDPRPAARTARPRSSGTVWVALGVVGVVMAAMVVAFGPHPLPARLLGRDTPPAISSLAVLPLDNLSGDPGQDYFADGMTDEVTTMLAKDSTLRIVSRTSAMQYKAAHRPLPEIARALHVDGILEGSISRSGDKVHMTLQLIRADTDTHLWAESYDRDRSDVAALPDEAAQAIARQLHSAVASHGPAHAVNPAAHDAYLRGRYFLQKREADKSASYFQQAVAIDPAWSQAYSGLAGALSAEGALGTLQPEEAMSRSEAAARRAIELDAQNGEAYSTLGVSQTVYEWKWTEAEENLKKGIALSPGNSEAELYYAIYLDAVNRPEEAVTHMRRALELDTSSFLMNRHLGSTLYFARHYDEALVHLKQAEEMEPSKSGLVEEWARGVYEMQGLRDKAVESDLRILQSIAPKVASKVKIDSLRALYKSSGWKAYWGARLKMTLGFEYDSCTPYEVGADYIRLGKLDLAYAQFDRAIDRKCVGVGWIMVDPVVDPIRGSKRYNDLLRRMNLPH